MTELLGILLLLAPSVGPEEGGDAAPQERATSNKRCIECHDKQHDEWRASIHAQKSIGCIECHGTDAFTNKSMPHLKLPPFWSGRLRDSKGKPRSDSPEFCGRCHQLELKEFRRSQHYANFLDEEDGTVKGCVSCHDFHKTTVANRGDILKTGCARCHKGAKAGQTAAMRSYSSLADGLEAALKQLDARIRSPEPGFLWTEERDLHESGTEALRQARTRQHFADYESFKKIEEGLRKASAAVAVAPAQIDVKEKGALSRRRVALAGFLVVVAATLMLARRWCIRSYGKE